MNFKEYAKNQRLNCHKEILNAICMTVNDCGACIPDSGEIKCNFLCCVPAKLVTETEFKLDRYPLKTERELVDIAHDFDYKIGFSDNYVYFKKRG